MENPVGVRELYRELADGYAARGQPQFRDRFLVLAADTALAAGDRAEAERFRLRLLAVNPHHLLKPYSSFAQAMESSDVQTYVSGLRRDYPPEVARGLKQSLEEVKDPEPRQVPVTSPLLNLGDGPDLLMDDDEEPLRILSLREDAHPPAVPPTLPVNKLPRVPGTPGAPPASPRTVPPTLYAVDPPHEVPPSPRPAAPRPAKAGPVPAPAPKPVPRAEPRPEPRAVPKPEPRSGPKPVPRPSSPPRSAPAPQPVPPPPPEEEESEAGGGWVASFLCGVVGVAGAAVAFYTLLYPFFAQR
jgi:hypothetical protein